MKKSFSSPPKQKYCTSILNIALLIVVGWFAAVYYFHTIHTTGNSGSNPETKTLSTSSLVQSIAKASVPTDPQQSATPKPVAQIPPVSKELSSGEDDDMHLAFSTDCSFYQDWQTLLVFHSAVEIGQKGTITRIASGCDDTKRAELTTLYQKLFPQYHVHFTPDFKMDSKTKKKYDFYNKPYGVQHWLDNAQPPVKSGVVIAILDPDMILMRPLTPRIANEPNLINLYSFRNGRDVVPERVKSGVAAGQLYGLGAPWTTNSANFNRTHVCGADSPCMKVERKFGEDHYSVGPPYILERDDLWKLTRSWVQMVPRVYERYPELLAEMYAYSMAAAHENLPHFTAHHWMVSNTFANDEGWPWIDPLEDDVCQDPVNGVYYPDKPFPTLLHYCQFFRAGELGFQKRRIKKSLFDCDGPMMAEPPKDLGKVNYKNRDGEMLPLNKIQARRNAFMLCALHKSINSMLVYYKSKMCGAAIGADASKVNYNKSINVVDKTYWS